MHFSATNADIDMSKMESSEDGIFFLNNIKTIVIILQI